MENNNNVQNGHASLLISVITASIAWIDVKDVDIWVKLITGVFTVVASTMAIRYYHYNTKQIKNELKKKD